jgi:hypothetical protein
LRQNQYVPSKKAVTQRCSPPRRRTIGCGSPQWLQKTTFGAALAGELAG